MKLTVIRLDRDRLHALPNEECTLLLALGHINNEVNAVTKMMYWAANVEAVGGPQSGGKNTFLLLLLRLLGGKLAEGWRLYEKSFFGAGLSKTYESKLRKRSSVALRNLKRYFGSKNAATIIRNEFGFHYSPDKLAHILAETDEELVIYMDGEYAPNTLFYFSEVIVAEALHDTLLEEGIPREPELLVSEFFDVALWFAQASDGLMDAIIEHNQKELRSIPPREEILTNLPKFEEVTIPWFADIGDGTQSIQGSA